MQEKYKAFIDGTDLQHHVESDGFGVVVYPSVDALAEHIAHETSEERTMSKSQAAVIFIFILFIIGGLLWEIGKFIAVWKWVFS
jgi:hypothetical protein